MVISFTIPSWKAMYLLKAPKITILHTQVGVQFSVNKDMSVWSTECGIHPKNDNIWVLAVYTIKKGFRINKMFI